jgi:hypothetical protein
MVLTRRIRPRGSIREIARMRKARLGEGSGPSPEAVAQQTWRVGLELLEQKPQERAPNPIQPADPLAVVV